MNEKKLTRRDFLKTATVTAASLALPTIIPARALGRDGAIAPSNRITMAHIGVGGQGSGMLQNFVAFDAIQSVAVCDPFISRREKWAAFINETYAQRKARGSYKGCATYNDFREVLARQDIDAVAIITPDHWHVPIALAAPGGQGHVCGEAARPQRRPGSPPARGDPSLSKRFPAWHLAAVGNRLSPGLRPGPQRPRRQDPDSSCMVLGKCRGRFDDADPRPGGLGL
jgi:hypothetical protein